MKTKPIILLSTNAAFAFVLLLLTALLPLTAHAQGDGGDPPPANEAQVSGLQWRSPSESTYHDVTGTLQVLKGTRVIFRAIRSDTRPWSPGKPAWSGSSGASGTGVTTDVTFSTLSTSTSDYKTVTAEGDSSSSATANIVVYELLPDTHPEDDFSGHAQHLFGIGEEVHLIYTTTPAGITPNIDWRQFSGLGYLPQGGSTFYAGAHSGGVTIRAWIHDGPSVDQYRSMGETVTEPTGGQIQQIIYPTGHASVAHDVNTCSVGFFGRIFLLPKEVSFSNIGFSEGGGTSTATNWLQPDFNNVSHPPTGGYLPVGTGNISTGCQVQIGNGPSGFEMGDEIGLGSYPRLPPAAPYGSGTCTWPIEWWYAHIDVQTQYETDKKFTTVNQVITCDANGNATISKAGSGNVTANATDATTAPPDWPGFPYPPQR